jgi:1D-myo-inositol-tetrakisphosphate 5-kinase/inositol-polyphosphate multikinase
MAHGPPAQMQRDFIFYSSSVLIVYEGDAATPEEANVSIRLVDFAHTFASGGQKDHNFLRGLSALTHRLTHVLRLDYADCLM